MFNLTDHLMRTEDQQLWNNAEKREELWAAEGGAGKVRAASEKENRPKRNVKKEKKPLTVYEKEERIDKIKVRIAAILATLIIAALVVIIIWDGM